jgi:hypothetical protein
MNRPQFLKKPLMRSLFFSIGLWILSIIFLSPRAVSAPLQVSHHTSVTPPTIAQAVAMTLPSQIFRRWTHSREEDQGDILVYRSSDYPFPPARGREGLEFRENGEFILYQIGSTDRSLGVPGQWSLHGANVVAVQFPDQSASSYTLTILECSEQILKVRQTAGNPSQ